MLREILLNFDIIFYHIEAHEIIYHDVYEAYTRCFMHEVFICMYNIIIYFSP